MFTSCPAILKWSIMGYSWEASKTWIGKIGGTFYQHFKYGKMCLSHQVWGEYLFVCIIWSQFKCWVRSGKADFAHLWKTPKEHTWPIGRSVLNICPVITWLINGCRVVIWGFVICCRCFHFSGLFTIYFLSNYEIKCIIRKNAYKSSQANILEHVTFILKGNIALSVPRTGRSFRVSFLDTKIHSPIPTDINKQNCAMNPELVKFPLHTFC